MDLFLTIANYVSSRIDFDDVLPSEEELCTKFENAPEEMIAEAVQFSAETFDMDGVKIEWEGDLRLESIGGIKEDQKSRTA